MFNCCDNFGETNGFASDLYGAFFNILKYHQYQLLYLMLFSIVILFLVERPFLIVLHKKRLKTETKPGFSHKHMLYNFINIRP